MKQRHTAKKTSARTRRSSQPGTRDKREEIADWLRDAYAMERGLEQALRKQADNDELSLHLREQAAMHLEETRRHAEEVRSVLKSLRTETSLLKTSVGMVTQATKGIGTMFSRDERIKDLLDAYSMEHFEIACYTALAAAANRAGLPQVVEMCRRILPDEERMAQVLRHSLPDEVTAYLFESERVEA